MQRHYHTVHALGAFAGLLAIGLAAAGCGRPAAEAQAAEAGGVLASAKIARQVAAPVAKPTPNIEVAADPAPKAQDSPAPSGDALAEPVAAPPAETAAGPPADDGPPKPRKGRAPRADRGPARPGEAEKITFDDLIVGMQADIVFRPFMLSDRAKELDGQRVSITGYMHGAVDSTKANKKFVLLRNTECKFGPGGQADHLAWVYLREGKTTPFTNQTVKVEGELKIEPFEGTDGNTWAIYRLDDALMK